MKTGRLPGWQFATTLVNLGRLTQAPNGLDRAGVVSLVFLMDAIADRHRHLRIPPVDVFAADLLPLRDQVPRAVQNDRSPKRQLEDASLPLAGASGFSDGILISAILTACCRVHEGTISCMFENVLPEHVAALDFHEDCADLLRWFGLHRLAA